MKINREMTWGSVWQVLVSTNQKTAVGRIDQSEKRRRAKEILLCYFSSPLQGSFDGDSFFSASAPRLASTLSFFAFAFQIAVSSTMRSVLNIG